MILQSKRPYRLAVIASHPIQYQVPLFRAVAAHPQIDLTDLFCSVCEPRFIATKDSGMN